MIYDEGFEILSGNLRFFFFNKYQKNKTAFLSDCSSTLIGWIYNTETKKRGCAVGSKTQKQKNLNKSTDKLIVTQNRVEKIPTQNFLQMNLIMQSSMLHQLNLVNHINNQNLAYTTKLYDRYLHKTFFEINSMAGRLKPF